MSDLLAITPIDGRYADKVKGLQKITSEYAYIRYRVRIEEEYFKFVVKLIKGIVIDTEITKFFDLDECKKVKAFEAQTNHDVKAIEYYIKSCIDETYPQYAEYKEYVHYCLTSNDVNSLAYTLQMIDLAKLVSKNVIAIKDVVLSMVEEYRDVPMLARTHGQPATPTSMGVQLMVFADRLDRQLRTKIEYRTKFGGATGGLNAHYATHSDIDWEIQMDDFVESFGTDDYTIARHKYTTQIDHYDNHSEVFDLIKRIDVILIDLCRDIWQYVSFDYFKLKIVAREVGSSAMPHKVNPIDFENAEGNLGMANAMLEHFSAKLPVSRLQRDLTDSTVLRNLGVVFGYAIVAYGSILKGLAKLELNKEKIESDLRDNWMVVSESVQSVLKRMGYPNPYEKLKEFTRRHDKIGQKEMEEFIDSLDIKPEQKSELKSITPFSHLRPL